MRKHPGFATTAVLMLAVGLGVNSAVFTVVNAALFRGVPLVHQSDRILRLTTNKDFIYYPDFEEWRDQAHAIKDAALVRGMFHTLSYGDGVPETSFTTETTANLFRMLNVRPMLGRDFSEADMQPSAAPVVILRYDVGRVASEVNHRSSGQTVRIDGLPTTIIGVMPQGFSFPSSQALWTPLIPTAPALRRETGYAQYAYARMGDGAKAENVRVQLQTVGRRLASAFPGTNASIAPVVEAFDDWFIGGNARLVYRAMWGAVGFLLLIVCANVANLLIEQGVRRSHEISIRMALGAGTQRIICQCLAES